MIIWNIVDNLEYWQPSQFVPIGARRRHVDSMYECITAGATGLQGPTGTDSNIVDGIVHWKYLCQVDYMSLSDWHDNTPSSLSDAGMVWIWPNTAPGYGSAEVVLENFSFQWDKTTNGFLTTITAAPGQSFADNLGDNSLWYNPNLGVAYNIQSSPNPAAFGASSNNLIISRLQFRTQVPLFSWAGSNIQVVGCISQQDGAPTFSASGANCSLIDCVIVDLIPIDQLASFSAKWGQYQSTGSGVLLNCTFLSYTPDALIGGFLLRPNPSGGILVENCLAFGAFDALGNFAVDQDFGGSVQYDHNFSDDPFFPSVVDSGNNASGLVADTIFVDPTADLRLLSSAQARGAGASNGLVPGGVDITGYTRGTSWDVGAWQYRTSIPSRSPRPIWNSAQIRPPTAQRRTRR